MIESTLNGQTVDIVAENVQIIKTLFPEIFSEDKIDFEKLQMVLGEYIENDNERYNFTWNGKGKALRLSQTPSTGTLRPCKEESKNWDTTQNLYIEGDNLEVLKLLQKTYHNKIKMIYIDPPYNTGNDFIYPDDYKENLENYMLITGQKNEDGGRISTNSETSGRYHTNWLNMIYPRVRLARNLLTDDGVMFVSIGQEELSNLQKLCNEIFGEENLVGTCSRLMKSGGNKGRFFSPNIDYVLVYAKNRNLARDFKGEMSEELIKKVYNQLETEGIRKNEYYRSMGLYQSSLDSRPNQRYWIECPDGSFVIPPGDTFPENIIDGSKVKPISSDGVWRWIYERYLNEKRNGNIDFKTTSNGVLIDQNGKPSKWNIYTKIWLNDRLEEGQTPVDIITKYENRHSAKELIPMGIPFDFAKPSELIKYLVFLLQQEMDIFILDFFSGSSTTAQAVMQLNAEDGGNRKFIMVQLPESCGEDTEAAKAGYKNICEIGKERIRRAGEKIVNSEELRVKGEQGDQATLNFALSTLNSNERSSLDVGFKVFKLDSSNLKKWNPDYDNLEASLEGMVSNYVDGRTELDVVYEIMLKYGIDLTFPVEEYDFSGKKVYSIGFGALVICLDSDITTSLAQDIVKLKRELSPETMRVVFKDNGFANDAAKTNVKENLRQAGIDEFVTV